MRPLWAKHSTATEPATGFLRPGLRRFLEGGIPDATPEHLVRRAVCSTLIVASGLKLNPIEILPLTADLTVQYLVLQPDVATDAEIRLPTSAPRGLFTVSSHFPFGGESKQAWSPSHRAVPLARVEPAAGQENYSY